MFMLFIGSKGSHLPPQLRAPLALHSAPHSAYVVFTWHLLNHFLNWQVGRDRVGTPAQEGTERSEPVFTQGVAIADTANAYSVGLCCVNDKSAAAHLNKARSQEGEECGKSMLAAARSECARGWATSLSTSSYIFSQLGGRNTYSVGLKCCVVLYMLDYIIYSGITSIQEYYFKRDTPTHLSIFIYKFSISPGYCHILTVLLRAAWNSWAMWFLRFYFRAAAVKHTALFTVALGIVDKRKIKSFNPAV